VDRALGEPTHGGWVGEWVFSSVSVLDHAGDVANRQANPTRNDSAPLSPNCQAISRLLRLKAAGKRFERFLIKKAP